MNRDSLNFRVPHRRIFPGNDYQGLILLLTLSGISVLAIFSQAMAESESVCELAPKDVAASSWLGEDADHRPFAFILQPGGYAMAFAGMPPQLNLQRDSQVLSGQTGPHEHWQPGYYKTACDQGKFTLVLDASLWPSAGMSRLTGAITRTSDPDKQVTGPLVFNGQTLTMARRPVLIQAVSTEPETQQAEYYTRSLTLMAHQVPLPDDQTMAAIRHDLNTKAIYMLSGPRLVGPLLVGPKEVGPKLVGSKIAGSEKSTRSADRRAFRAAPSSRRPG